MNIKKLLALGLAATLAVSTFAACGEADTDKETSKDGDAKEVLTMATNAAFPPYIYYETEGEYIGIDAEIGQAIADELGMTLEISDMDFDSIIVAVEAGQADIGMGGISETEDRLKNVDFSTAYAQGVQVVIVAEGSKVASIDDLADATIGVQQGTTGHLYCGDDYGQDAVTAYSTGALAVEALKNGQVDCVVIDSEPAKVFVEKNEGLSILETEYVLEDYAIEISKDNTELKDKVNAALETLTENGKIDEIIAKYIPAE